jgi:hypothetical protein
LTRLSQAILSTPSGCAGFTTAPNTDLTGLGRVADGRMGSKTSINSAEGTLDSRLQTVCSNMKAKN